MGERILVTGGSGFIGAHAIAQALNAGHEVRASLRTMGRQREVRAMVAEAGAEAGDRLTFAQADLMADSGWREAAEGCAYVLHIASPFPSSIPKHEDELIIPARDGALRVLRAAKAAGVKRVVLTSSFAAIGYGQAPRATPFTEEDWTDVTGADVRAYVKSKTLAERAAWDFMKAEGAPMELAVVNPVGVLGPVLAADYSTSILLVQRLMDGAMPGCPRFGFGLVDVRCVADLHLRAMTNPAAAGQRFLAIAGEPMWIVDVARTLKTRMGDAARRVPAKELPNWMVRLAALGDPAVAQLIPELGKLKRASNDKAKRLLGWAPRTNEEAIVATAESMVKLGLLKDARRAA